MPNPENQPDNPHRDEQLAERERFQAAHPELHHYTTLDGLRGIIESNTLWATHYLHLNDAMEVTALRAPLTDAVARGLVDPIRENRRSSLRMRIRVKRFGGLEKYARHLADHLIASVYKHTFDVTDEDPPLAVPYIASFCTHSGDQEYERVNGLLSQWRAYGAGARVCAVFNTERLQNLLLLESGSCYWTHLNFSSVVYSSSDVFKESPGELVERCIQFVLAASANREIDFSEGFTEFMVHSTLFKHRGFLEEREVRVVASPSTTKSIAVNMHENPDFVPVLPLKPVHRRRNGSRYIPYIKLFDNLAARLPITRVLVGPAAEQEATLRQAAALLGPSIPVVRSETPYIG
jgi:hypothetical protein